MAALVLAAAFATLANAVPAPMPVAAPEPEAVELEARSPGDEKLRALFAECNRRVTEIRVRIDVAIRANPRADVSVYLQLLVEVFLWAQRETQVIVGVTLSAQVCAQLWASVTVQIVAAIESCQRVFVNLSVAIQQRCRSLIAQIDVYVQVWLGRLSRVVVNIQVAINVVVRSNGLIPRIRGCGLNAVSQVVTLSVSISVGVNVARALGA